MEFRTGEVLLMAHIGAREVSGSAGMGFENLARERADEVRVREYSVGAGMKGPGFFQRALVRPERWDAALIWGMICCCIFSWN
jgi:hypothetical protein